MLHLDALRVKIIVDGHASNHCIYIALGVNLEGKKEALSL
ncbi:MAG: hypothetical protein D6735_10560 [Acidobacteria bacterium]|nr:MAG: hypothetical protein D6735_10560 [Acidobacteriota bacterium]